MFKRNGCSVARVTGLLVACGIVCRIAPAFAQEAPVEEAPAEEAPAPEDPAGEDWPQGSRPPDASEAPDGDAEEGRQAEPHVAPERGRERRERPRREEGAPQESEDRADRRTPAAPAQEKAEAERKKEKRPRIPAEEGAKEQQGNRPRPPAERQKGAAARKGPSDNAEPEPELAADFLPYPGYVPGYRRHPSFGLAPHTPRLGGRPGGMAAGYEAPIPPDEWTFRFSGFMKASLQVSTDERPHTQEGQNSTVYHAPPRVIEEYASFLSTSTVPGNWVSMMFNYGTSKVNMTVTIDTWNPSQPSTFYQMGSHYQFNNAFLTYALPRMDALRMTFKAGFFVESYGNLGEYGTGMYQAPLIGALRGVGGKSTAEMDLSDSVVAALHVGVMGNRDGKAADGVVPGGQNLDTDMNRPGSWMHQAHLGVVKKGDPELKATAHYMSNWSLEDRTKRDNDVLFTRQLDESRAPDGRITVYGFDASLKHSVYGYLGAGIAFIDAQNAFPLRGLLTFGGDGQQLTDRWLGASSQGNGRLMVGAVNYQVSLGKIMAHPVPFHGDGPDIMLQTGVQVARTETNFGRYNGRFRHKYGLDGLYTFLPWMGVGLRGDRVVPDSREPGETFHVISPRLQFKTDWRSRETIEVIYGKWFYGPDTRIEGTGQRTPDRMDDQLFAISFNMWW